MLNNHIANKIRGLREIRSPINLYWVVMTCLVVLLLVLLLNIKPVHYQNSNWIEESETKQEQMRLQNLKQVQELKQIKIKIKMQEQRKTENQEGMQALMRELKLVIERKQLQELSAPNLRRPTPEAPAPEVEPATVIENPIVLDYAIKVSSVCLTIAVLLMMITFPIYLFSGSDVRAKKAGGVFKSSFGFVIASGTAVISTLSFTL